MIGKLKDLLRTAGGEWVVSFTTKVDPRLLFDEFTDKPVDIQIKKASKRKTKTANDFMWAMCTDLAKALHTTKEEVYRKALWETRDDVQAFDTLLVREDAIEAFRGIWYEKGIGWFTQVVDYAQAPGFKTVLAFHGSSTFDGRQIGIVIKWLKEEMENQELPILVSKEEEERMMASWQKAYSRERKSASSAASDSDSKNTTSLEGQQTANCPTSMG